jgi:hypothetical protein
MMLSQLASIRLASAVAGLGMGWCPARASHLIVAKAACSMTMFVKNSARDRDRTEMLQLSGDASAHAEREAHI